MARYAYQAHFGILKIFELHIAGKDYRAVFDFLDDFMVLNSSSTPTSMCLFQLKTKAKGQWTSSSLSRRGKTGDLPRSFVGRMYYPITTMHAFIETISFVSNAPFDVQLASGKKSGSEDVRISGDELHSSEIAVFDKAIDADYPTSTRVNYKDKFVLEQCSLGLVDQDAMVIGQLVKHIEAAVGVTDPPVQAMYSTLVAKAIALTGNSATSFPDEASFYQRKTIGRDEINDLLKAVAARKGFLTNWSLVEAELLTAGKKTREIVALKSEAVRYLGGKSSGERDATTFARAASALAGSDHAVGKMDSVLEIAALLEGNLASTCPSWSPDQRKGACLVEGYEALNV